MADIPTPSGTRQSITEAELQRRRAASLEAERQRRLARQAEDRRRVRPEPEVRKPKEADTTVKVDTEYQKRLAEFEAKNVKLDTGEWVDKDWYNSLSYAARLILKTKGVAFVNDVIRKRFEATHVRLNTGEWVDKQWYDSLAYGARYILKIKGLEYVKEALRKRFEATHVQLKTGEWVSKEYYDKLGSSAQYVLRTKGVEFVNELIKKRVEGVEGLQAKVEDEPVVTLRVSPEASGEEVFAGLQGRGEIHGLAIYQGYNKETGEVSYTAPTIDLSLSQIKRYWAELEPTQQRIQANLALGKRPYEAAEPFSKLPEDEQDTVLRYYLTSYFPLQMSLKGEDKYLNEVWETQKYQLKELGLGMIPIYGTIRNWNKMSTSWKAVSVALDVAIVVPVVKSLIGAVRAARVPIVAKALQAVKVEGTLARQMSGKLQVSYGKPVATAYKNMVKAQSKYIAQLAKIEQATVKGLTVSDKSKLTLIRLEQQLRVNASTFVSKIRPKLRVDSAEISRLFTSLPEDMIRNAKAVVKGVKSTASIKTLRADVGKAEKALQAAQTKWPTAPSKWVDLIYDLAKAEARLYQAGSGSVVDLYNKLLAARRSGDTAKAAKLQRELTRAIKGMEVEWASGGRLSRGGVAVLEVKPKAPTGTPLRIGGKPTTAALRYAGMAAKVLTVPVSKGKPVTKTAKPVVKEVRVTERAMITTPEIIRGVDIAPLSEVAFNMAMQAINANMTGVQLRNLVENTVRTEARASAKPLTATQVKVLADTAIKRAKRVPLIRRRETSSGRSRLRFPVSSTVWKMGMYWKVVPPHWTNKPITLSTAPLGVKRTTGTPQDTLTFIGGKRPNKDVSFDLGVTDGFIDVSKGIIHFKGEGELTDVGKRLPSPTVGLSLVKGLYVPTHKGKRVLRSKRRGTARRNHGRTLSAVR